MMFRNKLIAICLVFVAGSSSLINGQVLPKIPADGTKAIPALAAQEAEVNPTTTTTANPPTTTTAAPTTPSTTKATTTPKPEDTTTSAPVTTTPGPNPVPIPEPPIGRWNTTCILLQMATQLNFTYATTDNKTARAIYNIPATATLHDVNCESNNTQEIVLNWGPANAIHSITIYFERNSSNVNVHTIMVSMPIDANEFINAKPDTVNLIYRGDIFEAPSHMSYHCTRPQILNATETIDGEEIKGTIRLSDVQMEAFRTENSTSFSTARDCDSSETPDIVPIAVGIALVALILIVLISYLCARRRSTARGYMSF